MTQPFIVQFNPVAFGLGPIQVHWYGLMYLLGFLVVAVLGEYRRRRGRLPVSRETLGDLFFYGMMGVIIGGRLWYMLFYTPVAFTGSGPSRLRCSGCGMAV